MKADVKKKKKITDDCNETGTPFFSNSNSPSLHNTLKEKHRQTNIHGFTLDAPDSERILKPFN